MSDQESHDKNEGQMQFGLSSSMVINAAPDTGFDDHESGALYAAPTATEMTVNIPYEDLSRPTYGPVNPFSDRTMTTHNILTGNVEQEAMSEMDFRTQFRTFETFGYARDPTLSGVNLAGQVGGGMMGTGFVGNLANAAELGGRTAYDHIPKGLRPNKDVRSKREKKGDSGVLDGENAYKGPWARYSSDPVYGVPDEPEPQEEAAEEEKAEEKSQELVAKEEAPAEEVPKKKRFQPRTGHETTTFHGKEERDYLGRTYMAVPQDLDVNLLSEAGTQSCFIPKRIIHTWEGHAKGVNAIRFLPRSAHLLLSAGMDSKLKIWDVYHDRSLLRSMTGHEKAIRDISFNNDGTRFLSASYDRSIKLWDTETGRCIRTFSTGKVPYCVTFNPNNNNVFLSGFQDKRIVQFDANTGNIEQTYDQHLGAVNTITFVDNNTRFVSTSDDKSLRAWDYKINVVIQYIAEPDMHSMPAVTMHPSRKWLLCQSLDNQIFVYGATNRFRINRKKRFTGHLVAGYACKPGCSPDGKFVSSGDSEGNVWVWDWKNCKLLKKFKAHDKVVMNTEWHPHETSKMATCSWDGKIHYWD